MIKHYLASITLAAVVASSGCGNGCASLEPIPGGFPAAARTPAAGQVRITQSGLATVAADPEALLGGLLGGAGLTFDVPASCGGNPAVCCPGGNPQSPCGPIVIDLALQPGDQPRLELHPVQGASRLDVTVRARVRTMMDIPVQLPVVGPCGVAIDTAPGAQPDIKLDIPINFTQDAAAGTTRVEPGAVVVSQLTSQDVRLTGSIGCQLASLGIGFFIGTLTSTFADAINSAITGQTCKACPSGDVAECGGFATACTDNVCARADGTCLQELGITGRARGATLFGSLSPGTLGAMDLYDVAGGYATTDGGGLALGLLGGFQPAGTPRDRCGPAAAAPPRVTIPTSPFFQGNTRPDTGAAFGLGFGLHQSQLDELAWSLYDGGMLCLTITNRTSALLNTDTFALLAPSMANLLSKTGAIAVGLRPQAPPRMALGLNTFTTMPDGTVVVDEPLLDITFDRLELDFFASVEDQYVRLFTVVTDLRLPLGMQVGADGSLEPVLGDLAGAFTNLSVKNSDPLTEAPADLAARLPTLLELALPGLAGSLGSFALPSLGGLDLAVTGITAVDNKQFLAIFADLVPAAMMRPVTTTAQIDDVVLPPSDVLADPDQWSAAEAPRLELTLGGDAADLEWSWRLDDGLWSAWSPYPTQTVRSQTLWLPGIHKVEVRARVRGQAATVDPTPVVLELPVAPERARRAGFHGAPGQGGCGCATTGGGGAGAAWPLVLVAAALGLRGRRRTTRRGGRRLLGTVAALALGATMPACDCGGTPPCGAQDCLPGEVTPGTLGRWNAVATDGTRTVVTTHDDQLGDLVLVDVAPDGTRRFTAVDGVPAETPTYPPSGYRGGVATAGPDVGAFTSVALAGGLARIAYQDRDQLALKFALETEPGVFTTMTVQDNDLDLGAFASLTLDRTGAPAIAYLAQDVPQPDGARATDLRLARATTPTPAAVTDWRITSIASAVGSCAGRCGPGAACLAAPAAGQPEVCVTPSTDCASPCADDQACVSGTCQQAVPTNPASDLPQGTGLFVNLVTLPDGRLAAVYYDRSRLSLVLQVETAVDSSAFAETILDGSGDRGWWASAAVGADGALHVAYQDARADTVLYVSWAGTPGPIELVDDGTRAGDRTHPVGAGATMLFVGGAPAIAYQDGATADLVVAKRAGGAWTATPLAATRALDGFHLAAAGATLAWDTLDPTVIPPGSLAIEPVP
ncbi:MAG: MYXO-CTERM sorting domain-containing protein [Kofleriaceae bacterium]